MIGDGGTAARDVGKLNKSASRKSQTEDGGKAVSIVRVGLGETKNFAEGYEAIFGKKDDKKKAEAAAAEDKKEEKKDEKKSGSS